MENNSKYGIGLIAFLLLQVVTIRIAAQDVDNTTWAKLGVKYEVLPKLTLSSNLEWRTEDDLSMTDRWGLDVGG